MERIITVECLRRKKFFPEFQEISVPFVRTVTSARLLTVILPRRRNVCLNSLADVLEHNCNRPCGWKRIKFCRRYFHMLPSTYENGFSNSGTQRILCYRLLKISTDSDKTLSLEIWMLQQPKTWNRRLLFRKNNFQVVRLTGIRNLFLSAKKLARTNYRKFHSNGKRSWCMYSKNPSSYQVSCKFLFYLCFFWFHLAFFITFLLLLIFQFTIKAKLT